MRQPASPDLIVPISLAALAFGLHLAFNGGFGYHHDELYFAACGQRLALGYVDQPPLVPWLAVLSRWLFGNSLRGLRFFPALAGSGAILVTGILARRLGGNRQAQLIAGLAMLIAPVYLRSQNLLAIPAFEPFFWALASLLVVMLVQEERPRLWLAVGAVAGLGLMIKHTMVFWAAGLVVGLLLCRERRQLRTPWPWLGAAVALLIFMPNLIWQVQNGWPTLEWLQGLNAGVMSRIPAAEFLTGQVLYLHPFTVPIWIAGLWFLLRRPEAAPFRYLGWIFVFLLTFFLISKGKVYYLAPAYPPLLAAGGVSVAMWSSRRPWLRRAIPALLVVGGMVMAPVSLPVLSIGATDRYIQAVTFGVMKNSYEVTADLHDQFGWEELVELVARAQNSLDDGEKERSIILATDRGAASAVDFFGEPHGLPPARSGTMSYYLWGYGEAPVETLVMVGFSRETLDKIAADVTEIGTFTHPDVNPWRNNKLVAVCRNLNLPMEDLWPQLKRW